MVDGPIDFAEKRRRLLEERAKEGRPAAVPPLPVQPSTPEPEWSEDAQLPSLLDRELTDEEKQLDNVVDNIDIVDGYIKWCGKMYPNTKGRTESIMISCPKPTHADKDPSAWINTDKQTWFCGGCEEGGDVFDIAAYNLGYPVPQYKHGPDFHKLRLKMAEDMGWRMKKVIGGKVFYQAEEPDLAPPAPESPSVTETPEEYQTPQANITQVPEPEEPDNVAHMWADEEFDPQVVYPTISWQGLIPEDTFLYEFMKATSNDDSPEEYHFWHGLLALGSVCGRNVTLDDSRPVYGNLMVCLLGNTGTGKSRSRDWLDTVLKSAAPYKEDGTRTTGVKILPVPGSGEYLVSSFAYEGKDPSNAKLSLGFQPVNGIVDFDEMSALLARANRDGSTLKSTLMAFADTRSEVKIGSLGRGDYIAVNPYCSITASTQPKAIRTLLSRSDTGSGFLNRWVFAGGKEKQAEAIGGMHSQIFVNLDESIQQLKYVRGWGSIERKVVLTNESHAAFKEYFDTFLNEVRRNDDTDLLKRIDLFAKKIMLLLSINRKSAEVSVADVEATKIIIDYMIACFRIINANIGITLMQDVMDDVERQIVRHHKKTGRGATARDIYRYTRRKNYSLDQIKRALETMTALDLIELEKKPQGAVGRPSVRYVAVGE